MPQDKYDIALSGITLENDSTPAQSGDKYDQALSGIVMEEDPVKKKTDQEQSLNAWDVFSNYASNLIPATKQIPAQLSLVMDQAEDQVYLNVARLAYTGELLVNHLVDSYSFANAIPEGARDLTGIERPEQEGLSADDFASVEEKAQAFADKQRKSDLRESRRKRDVGSVQAAQAEMKPTVGILTAIEGGDPAMVTAAAAGTLLDLSRSVAQGFATGGAAPVGEMIGNSYYSALEEKANALGIPVDEVIREDQDDEILPITLGITGGLLEKVGLKGISGKLLQKVPRDVFKDALGVAGTATKEGLTEWVQYGLESGNRAVAGLPDGTSVEESLETFSNAVVDGMSSREGYESLVAGSFGAGVMTGSSSALKRVANDIAKGDTKSIDQIIEDDSINPETIVSAAKDMSQESSEGFTEPITTQIDQFTEPTQTTEQFEQPTITQDDDLVDFDATQAEVASEPTFSEFDAFNEPVTTDSETYGDATQTQADSFSEPAGIGNFVINDPSTQQEADQQIEEVDPKKRTEAEEQEVLADSKSAEDAIVNAAKEAGTDLKKRSGLRNITRSTLTKGLVPIEGKIMDIAKGRTNVMDALNEVVASPLGRIGALKDATARKMKRAIAKSVRDRKLTDEDLIRVQKLGELQKSLVDPNSDVEAYQDEIERNKKKLRIAAQNKVDEYSKVGSLNKRLSGKLAKAKRAQEITEEVIAKFEAGEQVLSPEAQAFMDEGRAFLANHQTEYFDMLRKEFGEEPPMVYNYWPSKVVGGLHGKSRTSALQNEIDKRLSEVRDADPRVAGEKKPKLRKGTHAMELEDDIGSGFYEDNAASALYDYGRNVSFDVAATPAIRKMVDALTSDRVRGEIGVDNARYLLESVSGYINRERGAIRSDALRTMSKIRSNITAGMMGDPLQLMKQSLPAIPQSVIAANGNLGAATKAMKTAAASDPSGVMGWKMEKWLEENVPELYERGKSLERITLGEDAQKIQGKLTKAGEGLEKGKEVLEKTSTWAVNVADNYAARVIFFANYFANGGTIENPDPDLIRRAVSEQSRLQGANRSSLTGTLFNSRNEMHQFLSRFSLGLANFAIQQGMNGIIGMQNMDTASGRRAFFGGLTGSMGFAMTAALTSQFWKDMRDDFFPDEDAEEEDEIDYKEMMKKAGTKGAVDFFTMGLPIVSPAVEGFVNEINKRNIQKDYQAGDREESFNRTKDNIFYEDFGDQTLTTLAGPQLGMVAESLRDVYKASLDAYYADDEDISEKERELILLEMLQIVSMAKRSIPFRQLVNKSLREMEKQTKKEIKELEKQTTKQKKSSPRRRINLDNL